MAGTAQPNSPWDIRPWSTFDASRTGYGLRPSSLRIGVSTPCMTASTGATSCGSVGTCPSQSWSCRGRSADPGGSGGRLRGRAFAHGAPSRPPCRQLPPGTSSPGGDSQARRHEAAFGIPTVKDRVVQQATKLVLEPIFEADFLDCSFGFRPKRSAIDALEAIRVAFREDERSSSRPTSRTSSARSTTRGCSRWSASGSRTDGTQTASAVAAAGVLEGGVVSETVEGTPQGGVISPLLANIYLHAFDRAWAERGTGSSCAMRTTSWCSPRPGLKPRRPSGGDRHPGRPRSHPPPTRPVWSIFGGERGL